MSVLTITIWGCGDNKPDTDMALQKDSLLLFGATTDYFMQEPFGVSTDSQNGPIVPSMSSQADSNVHAIELASDCRCKTFKPEERRGFAEFVKDYVALNNIVAVEAEIECSRISHLCFTESPMKESYSIAFVCLERFQLEGETLAWEAHHGAFWSQVGYGYRRLIGLREIERFYFLEVQGDSRDTAAYRFVSIPVTARDDSAVTHHFRVELDTVALVWNAYIDSAIIASIICMTSNHQTPSVWTSLRGNRIRFGAEINCHDNDMAGTSQNPLLIHRIQAQNGIVGKWPFNPALSGGRIQTTDSTKWHVQIVDTIKGIAVWD